MTTIFQGVFKFDDPRPPLFVLVALQPIGAPKLRGTLKKKYALTRIAILAHPRLF